MPSTRAGQRIVDRYRSEQLSMRAVLLWEVLRLWPLLHPTRLDETAPAWLEVMLELIGAFRRRAAERAVIFYDQYRTAEIGAEPLDRDRFLALATNETERIRTSLALMGPARIRWRTGRGMDLDEAVRKALVDVQGAAGRHTRDGGRDLIEDSIREDKTALGWMRVTDADPCYFCAMLATRGVVDKSTLYTSREAALFKANGEPYHDHCNCDAIPVFSKNDEMPDRSREYAELYEKSTEDFFGEEKLRAFRRAYEAQRRDRQQVSV